MGVINVGVSDDTYHYASAIVSDAQIKSFTQFTNESYPYGSPLNIKYAHVGPTTLSGGTTNIGTNPITAGMFVLGVTIRVLVLVAGATSFKIGDGTDDDIWGATIALAAGTTTTSANFTAAPKIYTGNTQIVITAVGGAASFSAGSIRACVHYVDVGALKA